MPRESKAIKRFSTAAATSACAQMPWLRSSAVWRFIALRFLPLLAAFNLLWETMQLPLYTIWREASTAEMAFAVVHCTLGDVLIGTFALFIALTVMRAGPLVTTWPRFKVAITVIVLSVGYTIFSEWRNTTVLNSWTYSDLMPVVPLLGTGLSPLLQWVVIPFVTLAIALRFSPDNAQRS